MGGEGTAPRKGAPARGRSNIVLIGMPGSGKSTVGALLARRTGRDLLDTDVLVQAAAGRTLQNIVDREGPEGLRKREEDALISLDCRDHVIATGGSAVYSGPAMRYLRENGVIVFLRVSLETVMERVKDAGTRGLAKRPDQDLEDLFAERAELYMHYADIAIDCDGLDPEEICDRIIGAL